MIHPDSALLFLPDLQGYGVVALKPIPRGTIVWVRDSLDRDFSPSRVRQLSPLERASLRHFSYIDKAANRVLCWDNARYVNHSCAPTCISPGYEFEVAVRDIKVGEQLTNDYASLNLATGFDCLCGSQGCRGRVGKATPAQVEEWDRQLKAAWPDMPLREQPLWPLLQSLYGFGPLSQERPLPFRSSAEHVRKLTQAAPLEAQPLEAGA